MAGERANCESGSRVCLISVRRLNLWFFGRKNQSKFFRNLQYFTLFAIRGAISSLKCHDDAKTKTVQKQKMKNENQCYSRNRCYCR